MIGDSTFYLGSFPPRPTVIHISLRVQLCDGWNWLGVLLYCRLALHCGYVIPSFYELPFLQRATLISAKKNGHFTRTLRNPAVVIYMHSLSTYSTTLIKSEINYQLATELPLKLLQLLLKQ